MPKKTAAPAKAAAKTAKASKKAAAAEPESNGNGRSRGVDLKLAKQVAKMRDGEQSWSEISDELGISAGKAMLLNMYARVDDDDRITGNDTQIAKAVVKERKAGASWGVLMARTGLGEARLRSMYTDQTGEDTKGNRIGKGGRYPGDVKPDDEDAAPAKKSAKKAAAPAKKAAKAAKAGKAQGAEKSPLADAVNPTGNSPLVDWPLEKLKERLDGKTIKVVGDNDTVRSIKVRSIKKKTKDGEVHLTDQDGKSRTVLAVHIKSASK